MEQVPTMEGSVSFQSKQVRGAQYSVWGESEKKVRGGGLHGNTLGRNQRIGRVYMEEWMGVCTKQKMARMTMRTEGM